MTFLTSLLIADMDKLLPCPFCEGQAYLQLETVPKGYSGDANLCYLIAACSHWDCGCRIKPGVYCICTSDVNSPTFRHDYERAFDQVLRTWNNRPSTDAVELEEPDMKATS